MAKIVIIGGSFAGLTAAFELKRLLGDKGREVAQTHMKLIYANHGSRSGI